MTLPRISAFVALAASLNCSAGLMTFTDTIGDQFTSYTGMDITAVDVSNTESTLTFKISLNGNPASVSGGAFLIAIDAGNGGAYDFNSMTRPVLLSGMDKFIEATIESSSLSSYTNGSWSKQTAAPALSTDSSSITMTVDHSDLGIGTTSTIKFDVYTSFSASQYGAFDALSNPERTVNDCTSSYSSGDKFSIYTLTAVPEPAHYGLMCAAGLIGIASFQTWRKRTTTTP